MRLEHTALWTRDLEKMKTFYETYFAATASELYHNQKTGFRSYFMSFASGSRLELTTKSFLAEHAFDALGYSHVAIAVGDAKKVDELAAQFVHDGFPLLSGPRTTGDGYYEAVIQDIEGNLIELTTE